MIIRFFTFALWTVISAHNCFGCEQDDAARMAALSVSPAPLQQMLDAAIAYSNRSEETSVQNTQLAIKELLLEGVGADLIAEAKSAQGESFEDLCGKCVDGFTKGYGEKFIESFNRPQVQKALEQVTPYVRTAALGDGDLMQRWGTPDGVREEVTRLNSFRDQRRAALEQLLDVEIDVLRADFEPEVRDALGVKLAFQYCCRQLKPNNKENQELLLRYVTLKFLNKGLTHVATKEAAQACVPEDTAQQLRTLAADLSVSALRAYSRNSEGSAVTCVQNTQLAVKELLLEGVGGDLIVEARSARGEPFEALCGKPVDKFVQCYGEKFTKAFHKQKKVQKALEQVKPYALKAAALGDGDLMQRWSTSDGVQKEVTRLNSFREQRRETLEMLLAVEVEDLRARFDSDDEDVCGVKHAYDFCCRYIDERKESHKALLLRYVTLKFLNKGVAHVATNGAEQERVSEDAAQHLKTLAEDLSVSAFQHMQGAVRAYSGNPEEGTATRVQNTQLAIKELLLEGVGDDLIAEAKNARGESFEDICGKPVGKFAQCYQEKFTKAFRKQQKVQTALEQVKPYAQKTAALGDGDLMQRWSTPDGVREEVARLNNVRDQRRAALETLLAVEVDDLRDRFDSDDEDVCGVKHAYDFCCRYIDANNEDHKALLLRYVTLKFLNKGVTHVAKNGAAQACVSEDAVQHFRTISVGLTQDAQ